MSQIFKPVLVIFAMVFLLSSFKVTNSENYSLTVVVENLRNSKGLLQIALYNKNGSIPDEQYRNYFKMEKVNIHNGKVECTFSNLPNGNYAVKRIPLTNPIIVMRLRQCNFAAAVGVGHS